MALNVLGTKRKAPAEGTANTERKVPSNKRLRHSPPEHGENTKRQCPGTRRNPYCPEPSVANAREGRQYKGAKEPLLEGRPAAEIEDEEDESEDDDSGFDDEEDEEEDGDDEPYKADAVPESTFVNAGVKQFASGLEDDQTSEQSDDCEGRESEEELEDESEEESISSMSDDYADDVPGLTAHYERQWQREHDRFVATMEARIFEVQKGVEEAAAELSESEVSRSIAAPPDDTSINGQWRLYNVNFLAHEVHDHRLYLRTSTRERPVHDSNWNEAQGISFEILIQRAFPAVEFSCEGILPLTTCFPDSATLEPFRLTGKDSSEAGTASIGDRKVEIEHVFMDIVFLGNGYLKLYLPVEFLKNAKMRKQCSRANASGNRLGEDEAVEFIGKKDLPRHLRHRPKPPPSPKLSCGGYLVGYNS